MQNESESPLGLDNFKFSFEQGRETKKDLELRISAVQARIDKIVDKVVVSDVKVVDHFIRQLRTLTEDPAEIILVGKAMARIGEIIPELTELKKRHSIVEASLEDPHWVAATFADFQGDFPDEIPQDIDTDTLIQGTES